MATYSGAVDYIISQLGRGGETSITANVQQEVLNAIDYYSTTRFWFNEYTTKLTTSSSLAYYPLPADLQQIDSVLITISGSQYELTPRNYAVLDALDLGSTFGQPTDYAIWAEQFRLYPIPTATYTFIISGQKRLATLSATSDTNAWLTHGLEMICSRVQKTMNAIRYKNSSLAAACAQVEADAYERLLSQTEKLVSTGTISPG